MKKNTHHTILKKIKHYAISICKALDSYYQGEHISLRKGSGIEFADTRLYQYGDDVRNIHWQLSAKGHGTFVKTFQEEKEQTVFFFVDISASLGMHTQLKLALSREVCAVLGLASLQEGSKIGALLYSDKKEGLLQPGKDSAQFTRLFNLLYHTAPAKRTNLGAGLYQLTHLLNNTSIVIVISDFIDQDYEKPLGIIAKKHDLILLHVHSQQEAVVPAFGIVPFKEPETQRTRWVNTLLAGTRHALQQQLQTRSDALKTFAKKHQADYLLLGTDKAYTDQLIRLFQQRKRRA